MNETTTLSAPMTTSFEDYSDEESLIFNISTGNGSIHGSGNLTEEERLQIQINSSFGAWLVFMEMTLALIGIVLNLTVVISIREKESLLNNTVNIILGNLCFANLVAAVFVKSIAVVFHGYAVARSRWEVELAFCTVHTITSRATWAVFPYTLLVLCWHGLALRAGQIIASVKENKLTSTTTDAPKGYLLGATGVMGTMDLPMSRSTTADIEGMASIFQESPFCFDFAIVRKSAGSRVRGDCLQTSGVIINAASLGTKMHLLDLDFIPYLKSLIPSKLNKRISIDVFLA